MDLVDNDEGGDSVFSTGQAVKAGDNLVRPVQELGMV